MRIIKKTSGTRYRRFFAFFPVRAQHDNVIETRWLETVTVYEKYVEGDFYSYWQTIKFIDTYDDIEDKP